MLTPVLFLFLSILPHDLLFSTHPRLFFRVVQLDAVNKMKLSNVAMIFGPTLMSNENVSTDSVVLVTAVY